jgi:glutaconate CoA-transferase subunit B
MSSSTGTAQLMVTAAHDVGSARWVFTGINWPVLAARLARRLGHRDFVQLVEGGAALDRDTEGLLTSTTDFYRLKGATSWVGSSADVLRSWVSRCDLVVLDATNVDVLGRTNTTAIGPVRRPTVRMPGGGGAPDAAWAAKRLLLLYAGSDPTRIVRSIENITASPGPNTHTEILTRWGRIEAGQEPRLVQIVKGDDTAEFLAHLAALDVDCSSPTQAEAAGDDDVTAAAFVLKEASSAGYRAGRTEATAWR